MTTNILHPFVSAKADGPDATLVRPTNWNAGHNPFLSMTNRTGSAVVQYDACAVGTANDDSFTTTTTQGDRRPLVIVQDAAGIANNASGNVQSLFESVVNVQGNVTRGNYLRFSTTAGRLEDTGVAATTSPPAGAVAVAVTGYAGGGAGTVTAILGVTGQAESGTWSNVTASRAITTIYQNTSGKKRRVKIVMQAAGAVAAFGSYVDCGSVNPPVEAIDRIVVDSNAGSNRRHTHTFEVPNNWYYRVTNLSDASVLIWYELDE